MAISYTEALAGVSKSLIGLQTYTESDASFKSLALELGWYINAIPAPIQNLNSSITSLRTAIIAVQGDEPNPEDITDLASALQLVYESIKDLENQPFSAALTSNGFASAFPMQLVDFLLVNFLTQYQPKIYNAISLLGLIKSEYVAATTTRPAYVHRSLDFSTINTLIDAPGDYLNQLLFNTAAAEAGTEIFANKSLSFFNSLGFEANLEPLYDEITNKLYITASNDGVPDSSVNIKILEVDVNSGEARVGFYLYPLAPLNQQSLGIAVIPYSTVAGNLNLPLGDDLTFVIHNTLTASIPALVFDSTGIRLVDVSGGTGPVSIAGEIAAQLLYNSSRPADKTDIIRLDAHNGIAYDSLSLSLGLQFKNAKTNPFVEALIQNLSIKTSPGGTGFWSKILPSGGSNASFSIVVGWSKARGLYFGLNNVPTLDIPLNLGGNSHVLSINKASLRLTPVNSGLGLSTTLSGSVRLGPIQVDVEGLGMSASIAYEPEIGNLGPFDADFGLQFPQYIGLYIESNVISGGGSISHEPATKTYAGSIELSIKEKINVKALGLLQTELPNNREGYSFLLLITAEFSPIQLGLGFTLEGVGGLVGVNRTAKIDTLRAMALTGGLDTFLFPTNVLNNPQAAVAIVDGAFPAAEGRYVFGIMAKVGWGTGGLVKLDAALIIELPAPVRLILLGVLRVTLPDANAGIIRLRADFIGIVDFGAKKVAFDAVLVDSRILRFPLTGSFSFRLYQGDNPVLLMTAGGFHPAFHPPANADLPTLRRLSLSLAQGGDFRLTLTSYLAITSNTVQFGSRLDLYADLPGPFTLEGFFGFDALFRFNPFYLEVRIGASVAIKKGSRSVLTLRLDLLVSGPAPWHVDGSGKFKVLFIKVKFRVERTFGGSTAQPALPSTNLRPLLIAALEDRANWEIQQPAIKPGNTVVLRTEDQPTELVVDPGGVLAVRQKIAPLGYPMQQYGNSTLTNGNLFAISSVKIGTGSDETTIPVAALGELRDAFAPGQFRRMTDGEKLSSASFQQMRSGLRVSTLDGLVGKRGQTRTFAFEVTPGTTSNRLATPDQNGSSQDVYQEQVAAESEAVDSGGGTSTPTSTPVTFTEPQGEIPPETMHRLARIGAVGRSRRSYEQRRPSRTAPDMVLWDEDSYAIVSVRTLVPDPAAPNPFRTEAEATAYLTLKLAASPTLAGELQVVPVYQLDVSAPSTSANLVTA